MVNRHILVSCVWLFALFCLPEAAKGQENLGKISCICIDAGHGGSDPGAIQGKYREKDITLAVALKLGKLIENAYPDMKVVYTRKTDVAVDLWERGKIANKANAQLFISIHVNKFAQSSARGVETYVLGLHKSEASLEVAMRVLSKVEDIGFCELTSKDVVRHPLVQKIVQAYDNYEKAQERRSSRKERHDNQRRR